MNPKVFKAVLLAALGALVVTVFITIGKALAGPPKMAHAPIMERDGDMLVQTGWYTYPDEPGVAILYCTQKPTNKAILRCAVWSSDEDGSVITIEEFVAQELDS